MRVLVGHHSRDGGDGTAWHGMAQTGLDEQVEDGNREGWDGTGRDGTEQAGMEWNRQE